MTMLAMTTISEEVEQFEGFIEDDHGKEGAKQRDGVR